MKQQICKLSSFAFLMFSVAEVASATVKVLELGSPSVSLNGMGVMYENSKQPIERVIEFSRSDDYGGYAGDSHYVLVQYSDQIKVWKFLTNEPSFGARYASRIKKEEVGSIQRAGVSAHVGYYKRMVSGPSGRGLQFQPKPFIFTTSAASVSAFEIGNNELRLVQQMPTSRPIRQIESEHYPYRYDVPIMTSVSAPAVGVATKITFFPGGDSYVISAASDGAPRFVPMSEFTKWHPAL